MIDFAFVTNCFKLRNCQTPKLLDSTILVYFCNGIEHKFFIAFALNVIDTHSKAITKPVRPKQLIQSI